MNWAYIWCGAFILMLAWHIVERRIRRQVFNKAIDDLIIETNTLSEKKFTEFVESVNRRTPPSVRELYLMKLKGREG